MPKAEGNPGSGTGADDSGKVTVEIDGKTREVGKDEIVSLLSQQASITKKSQELTPLANLITKYGVGADQLVENIEGSFGLLGSLMEQGIIDEKGNVKERLEVKKDEALPGFKLPGKDGNNEEGVSKALGPVLAALEQINQRLGGVEKDQMGLLRDSTERAVKAKYPDFTGEDVSKLFARASNDKSKGLWDHAEALKSENTTRLSALEEQILKKHGIDPEAARNKLKEQSDEGGGLALLKSKEISFGKGPKKDSKSVTPMQAMMEHFRLKKEKGEI